MNAREKREQRLKLLEDHIGRSLAESAKSGELAAAPSYGKPLDFGVPAGQAERRRFGNRAAGGQR